MRHEHDRPLRAASTGRRMKVLLSVLACSLLGLGFRLSAAAGEAVVIPPFAGSAAGMGAAPAAGAMVPKSETAVLAGGCFWGVQGVFQHVKGVSNAVSGYAGGEKKTADYETVSSGSTGHAESVQISFDPQQITYARILQIYFSVVHDPTELNRQGPDSGTQYRSAVFPLNDGQARIAKAYIDQLNQAKVFRSAIVTRIEPDRQFFPAEGYHQNFLTLNPTYPYIVYNDLPKVEDLHRFFPDQYRADPVLVPGAGQKLR